MASPPKNNLLKEKFIPKSEILYKSTVFCIITVNVNKHSNDIDGLEVTLALADINEHCHDTYADEIP